MPPGFPDPAALHPMRFPGGRVNLGLVHLARAIDHPNIAVGDFTYASAFDPPGVARLLALAWWDWPAAHIARATAALARGDVAALTELAP